MSQYDTRKTIFFQKVITLIYCSWISYVLYRVNHHLNSIVVSLDKSEKQVVIQHDSIRRQLYLLQTKTDDSLKHLHKLLNIASESIASDLKKYLKNDDTQKYMLNWSTFDFPSHAEIFDDSSVDKAISARLNQICCQWEERHGMFSRVQDMLLKKLKQELNILESDLVDIEMGMDDNTTANSLSASIDQQNMKRRPQNKFKSINATTLPPFSPIAIAMKPLKVVKAIIVGRRPSAFARSPVAYAMDSANNMLREACKKEVLQSFINSHMSKFKAYLGCVEENIPNLIRSNLDVMTKASESREQFSDEMVTYKHLLKTIEAITNELANMQISLIDVKVGRNPSSRLRRNVVMKSSSCIQISSTKPTHGLWTLVRAGYHDTDDGDRLSISMRMYLPNVACKYIFREVAKVRLVL